MAVALVSFALTPVYAHRLSVTEFGLLALMLVMQGLMTRVYDLGFMNSVGRFFFDGGGKEVDGGRLREMSATSVVFLASYGGLLTVLMVTFAPAISEALTGTPDNAHLVRIIAVTLYAEGLMIVPLTIIRMKERSRLYVTVIGTRSLLMLGLNLVFLLLLDYGIEGVLWANAIASVAAVGLLAPQYRHAIGGRLSFPLLVEMLRFGLPFFPMLISLWLIDASDRYLLEQLRDRTEVGQYALAGRVAQVAQLAVAAISMGWAPLRYRIYSEPDAESKYRGITTQYVAFITVLVVALTAFAPTIVALIAPAEFSAASTVVPILVAGYALYGLFLMVVTGMGVTRKTAPMAWIGLLGAGLNIGLNLLLIPRYGMEAAAVSTVIAFLVMVVAGWYFSNRVYEIPYDWRGMLSIIALGALACTICAVFLGEPSFLGVGLASAVVVMFGASLLVLGFLDSASFRRLPELRNRTSSSRDSVNK